MKDKQPQSIYFVGAGGIGMANLVRYYLRHGVKVGGYDRTPSALTDALISEGADIGFEDDPALVGPEFRNPATTLVVYTPAVPESNRILTMFREGGFEVIKRAALLGKITRNSRAICIAGSHGKTTTCSMTANILRNSEVGCTAFLGGILRNTGSNLVLQEESDMTVIEADEYDRSFHHLTPWIAVVTSTDPDHLDIYGDEAHYLEAFSIFTSLIRPGGTLITHTGLNYLPETKEGVTVETYSGGSEGDWHTENIRFGNGKILFDLIGPDVRITDVNPGVPAEINLDNAVAAAAAAWHAGASDDEIRNGRAEFRGARRRFEIHLDGSDNPSGTVLIDDYAHSPHEVEASIASIRKLYPGKRLSVIFQPHLYTRTHDFAADFAKALSGADEVIMPEIYAARELPIPGVDSHIILSRIEKAEKHYCERKDLLNLIKNSNFEILMTLGAADIDRIIPKVKEILQNS